MSSIGKISLDLGVNQKGFSKQVKGIEKQTTKAFGGMSVAVGNIMANMVTKAISNIGRFVKDTLDKGSEISELQNVVDSVFTTMSDKVENFSKNALESYGLTEASAKKMVGTFGAMSKSFGYTEKQALDMSTTLTALAGDVASFYNLTHDVAYTKLKSVFTGETESLKELGVVMTQTALDQFALQNGFGKTTNKMSEQEKVALRLAFVQDKLSVASGDFIRTQDQWANQTRILSGQFDSFKAKLGQGFINVLTPVIRMLNILMGKLVQAADAFRSFTEMIMGNKSKGSAGAAMKEVAEAAELAAGSTGGIEDAADGAAAAATKAQKSLMGFDEINRLSGNNASGSDMSGASFESIDFGSDVEAESKLADSALGKVKKEVNELIGMFKEGFKLGIGPDFENSLKRIKSHIEGIKSGLKGIFTDQSVVSSAQTSAGKISKAFGQAFGSIASIGQTTIEMLAGGFDKFLGQNGDNIKKRLIGIFDVVGEYYEIAGNLAQAIASVFEVFRGDSAKQITSDFIGIFTNARLGSIQLAMSIGRDVLNAVAQPIIENKEKIKEALENTLAPISTVLSTLNTAVKATFDKIFEVYEAKVQPAFKGIADGLSSVVSTLLDAYNNYIAPVLQRLSDRFSEVWTSSIQPTINKAIEFIGKVCEAISVLWKNFLVPIINWIISNVVPVLAPIFEKIYNLMIDLFGKIASIIGSLFDILGGVIDFIIGVFTGDWSRAWDGIKKIFTGIWESIGKYIDYIITYISGIISIVFDGIKAYITIWLNAVKSAFTTVWNAIKSVVSTVLNAIKSTITSVFNGIWNFIKGIINVILGGIESLVNGVINGINMMVNAMNRLKFDVPDWVPAIGGKSFGFNIPTLNTVSLPRLAEGGYVRANQPQPVIVGDNKRQGEIISPEDKMLSVVIQALEQFFSRLRDTGYNSGNNNDNGDIIIPIYLDGTLLDEVIVTAQQRRSLRSGGI